MSVLGEGQLHRADGHGRRSFVTSLALASSSPIQRVEPQGVIMLHTFTEGREELRTPALLSRIVEQIADSVILTDTQGVIQYVNPAFEVTSGYSRGEALGNTPRILKSGLHDAEFYRQMWVQVSQGRPFKGMVI